MWACLCFFKWNQYQFQISGKQFRTSSVFLKNKYLVQLHVSENWLCASTICFWKMIKLSRSMTLENGSGLVQNANFMIMDLDQIQILGQWGKTCSKFQENGSRLVPNTNFIRIDQDLFQLPGKWVRKSSVFLYNNVHQYQDQHQFHISGKLLWASSIFLENKLGKVLNFQKMGQDQTQFLEKD